MKKKIALKRIGYLLILLTAVILLLASIYTMSQISVLSADVEDYFTLKGLIYGGFGLLLITTLILIFFVEREYKLRYNNEYLNQNANAPNLIYLHKALTARLAINRTFAVMSVAIRNFPRILEKMGEDYTLRMLRLFSKQMMPHLDKNEVLAYAGEGCYVMMLEASDQSEIEIRQQIFSRIAEETRVDSDMPFTIRLNYGSHLVRLNRKNVTADSAIKASQDALAAVKTRPTSTPDSMPITYSPENKIDFGVALANGLLRTHYTPIYSVADSKLQGHDVLLLLQTTKGFLPSPRFIKLAEREGRAGLIFDWMRHTVCSDGVRFNNQMGRTLPLNLRLHKLEQHNPSLISEYNKVIENYKLTPKNFNLEVGMNEIFADVPTYMEILDRLTHAGFGITVTGFDFDPASFQKLKRFSFSCLKFDVMLLKSHMRNPTRVKPLVEALRSLKTEKKIRLYGYNVEGDHDEELIKKIGIDYYARTTTTETVAKTISPNPQQTPPQTIAK